MFKKVLIANRGEIAVRIIRACRDLGISPVAIYSEVDRASLHVRLADEAYAVGAAPSEESYLNIGRVIETAQKCKAEAIHPGYGFLSENARFAEACRDAGLVFIGPSPQSMQALGAKTSARSLLKDSEVPVVPGTYGALESIEQAHVEARRIGYPVMLKASAGGGGKGMRLVENERELTGSFALAASEALRSFGDSSLYLEKCIRRPRHVEIQVLADSHGNAVYLGERECSLQRRHQKLVEECPSPLLDAALRRRMGEAALRVIRAADYENAGTVEFLIDQQRNFYFLEVNARLQVEHPVTELVTGVDLVREQFRIAAGLPLQWRQEEIHYRGWALECRVYAEDPKNNFFPSPGVIRSLALPEGPGVRVDSGVYPGWEVPIYYDPLIAKVSTWAPDREQTIRRMQRALAEFRIEGIRTNLRFFSELLEDPDFLAGRLSTDLIGEFLNDRKTQEQAHDPNALHAAAAAAALAYVAAAQPQAPGKQARAVSAWKLAGRGARTQRWK
jgi:acetyl-CoA carboxylase biotin carboxylase subunit